MADPQAQSKALRLAEALNEWSAVIGAAHPLILAGAGLVNGIIRWAKEEGIDPGPYEAIRDRLLTRIEEGLAADEAYRGRHGGGTPQ